jgi:hypothetical protein
VKLPLPLTAFAVCALAVGGCQSVERRPAPPPAPARVEAATAREAVAPVSRMEPPIIFIRASALPNPAPADTPHQADTPPAVLRIKSRPAPAAAGARAPDFRWIIGRLEHDAAPGRWYVRYDDPRSGDPDGGALELIGLRATTGLVAGELVRVEGQRTHSGAPGQPAAYHLTKLHHAGGPVN